MARVQSGVTEHALRCEFEHYSYSVMKREKAHKHLSCRLQGDCILPRGPELLRVVQIRPY